MAEYSLPKGLAGAPYAFLLIPACSEPYDRPRARLSPFPPDKRAPIAAPAPALLLSRIYSVQPIQ